MKKLMKKALTELLKNNQEQLVEAINELIPGSNLIVDEYEEITFSIEAIEDTDEISSTRIDYRLQIRAFVKQIKYDITQWFTYDYTMNKIYLTDNYIKFIKLI